MYNWIQHWTLPVYLVKIAFLTFKSSEVFSLPLPKKAGPEKGNTKKISDQEVYNFSNLEEDAER